MNRLLKLLKVLMYTPFDNYISMIMQAKMPVLALAGDFRLKVE
jgi:hypothetical protein